MRFSTPSSSACDLPSSALGLVGFSQGTMVALAVGLTRNPAPAAIVGYSGALADVEALAERSGAGPAILLVHGDMDEVIPVDAMLIAREQLAQAGLPVEWHVARRASATASTRPGSSSAAPFSNRPSPPPRWRCSIAQDPQHAPRRRVPCCHGEGGRLLHRISVCLDPMSGFAVAHTAFFVLMTMLYARLRRNA